MLNRTKKKKKREQILKMVCNAKKHDGVLCHVFIKRNVTNFNLLFFYYHFFFLFVVCLCLNRFFFVLFSATFRIYKLPLVSFQDMIFHKINVFVFVEHVEMDLSDRIQCESSFQNKSAGNTGGQTDRLLVNCCQIKCQCYIFSF